MKKSGLAVLALLLAASSASADNCGVYQGEDTAAFGNCAKAEQNAQNEAFANAGLAGWNIMKCRVTYLGNDDGTVACAARSAVKCCSSTPDALGLILGSPSFNALLDQTRIKDRGQYPPAMGTFK